MLTFLCSASNEKDSLLTLLKQRNIEDTSKVSLLVKIAVTFHKERNFDSALVYLNKSVELSKKLNFKFGEGLSYKKIGNVYVLTYKFQSNYPRKTLADNVKPF